LSFQQALGATAAEIDTLLDQLLPPDAFPAPRVTAAMRYAALGQGKRLRPFLVVESAALFAVPRRQALRAGAALECVHCYSLVHDDLPAMDDDDLRRGKPTAHRAFDEATAILAGDALLTYAFDILRTREGNIISQFSLLTSQRDGRRCPTGRMRALSALQTKKPSREGLFPHQPKLIFRFRRSCMGW
jgi:geranylgeranyl pyrophosphate synthase